MQDQVNKTFDTLWNTIYDRNLHSEEELGVANDNSKFIDWSDGHITSWLSTASAKGESISILDAGCGGGYGLKSILEINKENFQNLVILTM
jgi:hypothetical protein